MRTEKIGDAVLYLCDCSEIAGELAGGALVVDPPYGVGACAGIAPAGGKREAKYPRKRKGYIGGWDNDRPEFLPSLVTSSKFSIVWGGNYLSDMLPRGGKWLFWDKLNAMPSYSDGEIAWSNLPGKTVKKFTRNNSGLALNRDGGRFHPTQKPVALMEWCISMIPDKSLVVIDPYMGTGTTGVAALRMGRKFIGVERDEKYFEIACDRIEKEFK